MELPGRLNNAVMLASLSTWSNPAARATCRVRLHRAVSKAMAKGDAAICSRVEASLARARRLRAMRAMGVGRVPALILFWLVFADIIKSEASCDVFHVCESLRHVADVDFHLFSRTYLTPRPGPMRTRVVLGGVELVIGGHVGGV